MGFHQTLLWLVIVAISFFVGRRSGLRSSRSHDRQLVAATPKSLAEEFYHEEK